MPHPIRQGDIPGVQLRRECELELTADEAWRWLAEPELLRLWLATEVRDRSDDLPGWTLVGEDEMGEELIEDVKSLVSEPPRRWGGALERRGHDWESATRLTLHLHGDGPCELSVVQQGFERLSLSRCLTVWEFYRRRWRLALERLVAAVERHGRP